MQPIKWLVDYIDVRLGVKDIYIKELRDYLLPRNVNVWYTLGAVLIVLFKIQIITGILLILTIFVSLAGRRRSSEITTQ